jgi:hypothetical protein
LRMDFGDPETVLTVTAARRFWPKAGANSAEVTDSARLSLASVRSDLLKFAHGNRV